jgi:cysteine-rich repeat protein
MARHVLTVAPMICTSRPRPGGLLAAFVPLALASVLFAGCDAPHRDAVAEDCHNMIDDDGNGAIDCQDVACMGRPACTPEICGNDLDDDGDGRFDCADSDCVGTVLCGGMKCGNGMLDPGEDCDADNLGGRTCITQGFVTGTLACASCQIDTSHCSHAGIENCQNGADDDLDGKIDCLDEECFNQHACLCGNHVLDEEEPCDGALLIDGADCVSQGFGGGTLSCQPDCSGFDTSTCTQPECGDSSIAQTESCDDGNTTAGDGCDATCQIELDNACARAKPLEIGVNTGNTAISSFKGFVDVQGLGEGGKEDVRVFTPTVSGTLTMVLNTEPDLSIYVRTTCVDQGTEVASAYAGTGTSSDAVNLPVTAGQPVTVFIDSAYDSTAAGPYTLIVFESTP